jgi:signal transduction histidine kinase
MKKSALLINWLHQRAHSGPWLALHGGVFRILPATLFWLVTWLGAGAALAQNKLPDAVLAEQIGAQPLALGPYIAMLEDPDGSLSLADVRRLDKAGRFRSLSHPPATQPATSATPTTSASVFWLRLHLRSRDASAVLLEMGHPNLSDIQVFQQAGDNDALHQASVPEGDAVPFAVRPYRNRYFVVPLALPAGTDQSLYLRIKNSSPVQAIPLRLWRDAAFHAYERNDYARQASFFGLAMALVLFNLLLFFLMRDVNHLWYVLLSTALTLAIAANNGIAAEFLWGNWPWCKKIAPLLLVSLASMALLQFMRSMLVTRQVRPGLDRWLKIGMVLNGAIGLLLLVSESGSWLAGMGLVLTALLVLSVAVYCVRQGQRGAWFFVAAFMAACVAAAIAAFGAIIMPDGIGLGMGLVDWPGMNLFASGEMQLGAAIQMLLWAFALVDRFNVMRKEKEQAQKQAFETRQILVENLRRNERLLEQRVEQRSVALSDNNAALSQANAALDAACQVADAARGRAEQARQHAMQSLDELRTTQSQIIQAEKMAALGQLIASVAHEINTPIGAIKCSGENISDTLAKALSNVARVFQRLDADHLALFLRLIGRANTAPLALSSREARFAVQGLTLQLQQHELPFPRHRANILVQLHAQSAWRDYLPLLLHPESELLVESANNMAVIINNTNNIRAAVERASKIIFALKTFSQFDPDGKPGWFDLRDGVESVLQIYHNQIKHTVLLERNYDEIDPLYCLFDELTQVWHNLIHNALQAMKFNGRLSIGIHQVGQEAVVSVSDSGCGIEPAIRDKIFDAFFTTKVAGEGSGLGLDIVKKIVARHHGRIEVDSQVGVGSTFSVYLPYGKEQA